MGGLILISPRRNLPHRSGTYSNLKPSRLLQCCKIYKRITSLNRLVLQTQTQASHNTEGAGQEEEEYSQRVVCSNTEIKSALWGFSFGAHGSPYNSLPPKPVACSLTRSSTRSGSASTSHAHIHLAGHKCTPFSAPLLVCKGHGF